MKHIRGPRRLVGAMKRETGTYQAIQAADDNSRSVGIKPEKQLNAEIDT